MHLLRMKSFTLRWLDTILHVALIHETFETLALAFYAVVELIVAPAMNNEYALCWELWRAGGLLIYSPSTFESLGSVLLTQDSDSRCGASRWQKTAAWSKCWCLAVIIPHRDGFLQWEHSHYSDIVLFRIILCNGDGGSIVTNGWDWWDHLWGT